jgi:pilus assembly protein CpaC
MHWRDGLRGAALAAGLLLASAAPALAQSETDSTRPAQAVIGVGKSQVIELPVPFSEVMIADPKIADVLPITARSVYVVGKSVGSTALTLYGPGKSLIASVDIVISADISSLKGQLSSLLPAERISVSAANQSIVLSGVVASPSAMARALALAESYAPGKVLNMLSVEGTQQIMLSVRFVEMQRSVAKDLKVNVSRPELGDPSSPGLQITTGDTLSGTVNVLENTFGAALQRIRAGGGNLSLLFDALEQKGLVKTLAEPTLVAMSGDTASFLAGGEFPIPIQGTSGTNGTPGSISIEYKRFGVALAFTPTLLQDGMINLVVNPEVSSLDREVSIVVGPVRVPGIKVRRAHTTVELRDGESFTIAGLLRDDYISQIRQYPFIGDIPVLGALFRSNGYKHEETELVIVVTPHLVTARRGAIATPADGFVPASDFERFLLGAAEASATTRPEVRALMSSSPGQGGIEGPHGHVLH